MNLSLPYTDAWTYPVPCHEANVRVFPRTRPLACMEGCVITASGRSLGRKTRCWWSCRSPQVRRAAPGRGAAATGSAPGTAPAGAWRRGSSSRGRPPTEAPPYPAAWPPPTPDYLCDRTEHMHVRLTCSWEYKIQAHRVTHERVGSGVAAAVLAAFAAHCIPCMRPSRRHRGHHPLWGMTEEIPA